MLRKTLFWMHLTSGVVAGLVIFMMSFTGVILTYERQLLAFEDRVYQRAPQTGETRLPLDTLLGMAQDLEGFTPDRLVVSSNPTRAVVFSEGRSRTEYLDSYIGVPYTQHDGAMASFLADVRGWHRWFNQTGDSRDTARMITGASNLLFLFLLCSGLYLWLPGIINRATLRLRLWFHPNARSGAARDFNWHHVFGFWSLLPLIVIVATATVFYYPWANNLVYQLAGETPPARGSASATANAVAPEVFTPIPLDRVVQLASARVADWNTLSITLPADSSPVFTINIDQGNGGQPQKRHNLSLAAGTGEVMAWEPFSSLSAGRQARSWVRFLHTGEALGIPGQTVAGLVSFAALVMVWTGLALSWRRLRNYLARRRRSQTVTLASSANSVGDAG